MELWLWMLVGLLALLTAGLAVKLLVMRHTAREIDRAFAERLTTDTNTLITISSRDAALRQLAAGINVQLRLLRSERHRFQQGDAELKQAVTNISHDLRTPLTAICGYLDLLEQEPLPDPAAQYLGIIRDRTELLRRLTDELFRYSVILAPEQSAPGEPVVLNHALEESLAAFYAALCARGITPEIRMPEAPVVRTLDCSALARVFANLLTNALRYSDGDLAIALTEAGEVRFSNTAAGLNEVQVGKLFDRFYTVENARNATGLGLSIAKTLVTQMGGSITAGYEDNRLCICVRFPEAEA